MGYNGASQSGDANQINKMDNKHGYAIYSTPGLIQEGRWPLTHNGVMAGRVERTSDLEFPAAPARFATQELAEDAMHILTAKEGGKGSRPAAYAGLHVAPTWPDCAMALEEGGQAGIISDMPKSLVQTPMKVETFASALTEAVQAKRKAKQ